MMEGIKSHIDELEAALLKIDRVKAAEVFENTYVHNHNFEALEHLTMEILESIGTKWEEGQVSLSQVYMSGIICEELIEEYMPKDMVLCKRRPKLAIGVLLDHHGLGKRIVCSVLRAAGYNLVDFGQGVTVEEMVEKTIQEEIDILLISTLILPTALKVKEVVAKLREKGSSAKVVVGGAPFRLDPGLWKKVNADAVGKNGTKVKHIIKKLEEGDGIHEFNGAGNDSAKL